MDDKGLRDEVVKELEFEPSIDAAHIGVAVEKGIVTPEEGSRGGCLRHPLPP